MVNITQIVLILSSYFIVLEEVVYVSSCETLVFLPIFILKEAYIFNIECISEESYMIIYTSISHFLQMQVACIYQSRIQCYNSKYIILIIK